MQKNARARGNSELGTWKGLSPWESYLRSSALSAVHEASALSPALHHFERFLHAHQRRVGVLLILDDIPLHTRGRLAHLKNLLPRLFVIADEGVGLGFRIRFHMHT